MIKKGEHLEGVEPINEKLINNKEFFEIIKNRFKLDDNIVAYLKKIINGRNVYDKSGYSGSSTIIVNKDINNTNEFVIKFQKKGLLKNEFISYNYFYKHSMTTKPIKYFCCGEYELMIVEKNNMLTAGYYFDNYQQISIYFGEELRKFHNMNLIDGNFTIEEKEIFRNKYKNSFKEAINNDIGLKYLSMYMDDYDYESMKKYLIKNKNILFDDIVLVHGDFNPNNIFVGDEKIKMIDFKDSGFVDRHYDIFWTMFMIIIFSGILTDKKSIVECEKIFLDSYGRDLVDEKKLDYFKKFCCLYWKQHDEITRINIL